MAKSVAVQDVAPVEVRRNDDGSIDELIVKGATVCIEQMDDDEWSVFVASEGRSWIFRFLRNGKAIELTGGED